MAAERSTPTSVEFADAARARRRSKWRTRVAAEAARLYNRLPMDPEDLRGRIGRILERRELNDRLAGMQMAVTRRYGLQSFVHHSPAMSSLVRKIAQVAPTSSTVLILGESGVGKELVAKAIHFNSP